MGGRVYGGGGREGFAEGYELVGEDIGFEGLLAIFQDVAQSG